MGAVVAVFESSFYQRSRAVHRGKKPESINRLLKSQRLGRCESAASRPRVLLLLKGYQRDVSHSTKKNLTANYRYLQASE